MNNLPRQMLRQILIKYGREVCADAKRCENLLNDLCGSYRREINVLVNAIEERVPLDLLAGSRSMPTELLLNRLEKRLEEQTAMTREAASWAVESWALALGVATDAQIETRKSGTESAPPSSGAGTIQPNAAADKNAAPKANRTSPVQRPPAQRPAPLPPPKVYPPPTRQPTKMPSPLPPVFSPKSNPPAAAPPMSPQPTNQPAVVKRRFGLFRGCLLVVFLLIVSSVVLFLGVPYALEVMRETQRERNDEPPRFPAR